MLILVAGICGCSGLSALWIRNDLPQAIVATVSAKGPRLRNPEPVEYRLKPNERVETKLKWFFDAPERIDVALFASGKERRWALGPADYTPQMREGSGLARNYQLVIGPGRPVIHNGPGQFELMSRVLGDLANGLYAVVILVGGIVLLVKWRRSRLRPWQL